MNISGKVFVVTGASQGLGKAICEKLELKGAKVAKISRNMGDNSESSGSFSCDITDKVQVKDTVAKIVKQYGVIDGLINCAGLWLKTVNLEDNSLKDVEKVLDTNLKGAIFMTSESMPYLKSADEASIVNISSKSGTRPMELQAVYCASKYGLKGFTDSLKLELKGSSVKVMGFYPSGMNTKMFEKAGENFPAETFMDVSEIAEIIVFAIERPGNISIEEIQIEKY